MDELEKLLERFEEHITPRLSLMKEMPAIVAVCKKTDNRTVVVRWDADLRQWVTHAENAEGHAMLGSHKVFDDDDSLIGYMFWHNPITYAGVWKMLQQTGNGRFNTMFTIHWNEKL